ncbi:MAG: helix-turn-helix transcriptional regulator [Collimonas sp.]|uniref:helix-turn-helix domain-containing protein n=1 Tax=Collimonas sp. TaxID=1963772 RepID=UPI003267260F
MRELIGSRLRAERERLGYNQIEFAAIGGASNRTQVDWERGKQVPNAEFLALVAVAGVDVQYILTGKRSSIAMTLDEEELLTGYRGLDIRGKAGVLGMVETLGTPSPSAIREKQAQLAHPITGKNAQINSGKKSTNISGNAKVKIERKKKDGL